MGKIIHDSQKVNLEQLRRLHVLTEGGESKQLPDLWRDKTTIMIFVRHFGCVACRSHVDNVWKKRDQLERPNSHIVFIGNGSPELITRFKAELGLNEAPIYTDPTLKTFDACGLKRSLAYLLDPRGVKKFIGLHLAGYRQGPDQTGPHTQMGGVVVIKSSGEVAYHFIADYLGDEDKNEAWNSLTSDHVRIS